MTTETDSPPAGASNGELIRWAFAKLNERDTKPLRRFWSDKSVQRFPDKTCVGEQEIAAYFESAFAAMPDWHMQVVEIVERDEHVFVHWHLTGTFSGEPFQGIEPNGKEVALDGMDHFVLRDGQTVTNTVIFDQMQFARQIGLMPPDGSGADKAMKLAFNAKTKLQEQLQQRFSG